MVVRSITAIGMLQAGKQRLFRKHSVGKIDIKASTLSVLLQQSALWTFPVYSLVHCYKAMLLAVRHKLPPRLDVAPSAPGGLIPWQTVAVRRVKPLMYLWQPEGTESSSSLGTVSKHANRETPRSTLRMSARSQISPLIPENRVDLNSPT